ncbi:carotenoid oxygenase family protein [Ectothiorhodospiraceae bacterium WFHF3C12]|nr:carotenoid oxygenase family protein [Ectothiorhodospiraceae bacterium WFHF3C12]
MQRRDVLRFGAAGGAALAFGGLGLLEPARASQAWLDEYRAARDGHDWLLGVDRIADEQLRAPLEHVSGRLPKDLRGTFYRNGPALHHLGGRRYHHWFDADGMIQAFRFGEGGVSHFGRYVQTHKHRREREAGTLRYPAFGTKFEDAWPVDGPDDVNAANTNILPFNDRLLALWEGGSAYALEPGTLETRGPVTWGEGLQGLAFSAHPSVEPDGTLWNFGVEALSGKTIVYEIAPDGRLRRASALSTPSPAMVHDFVVTNRYLVFLMPPLRFDAERMRSGESFLRSHQWHGDEAMTVLVVDKSDLSERARLELPAGFVFHLAGGWDEGDTVHLAYERYADAGVVLEFASELMRGRLGSSRLRAQTHRVTLDLARGKARQAGIDGHSEFPRIHPAHIGRRYRYQYSVTTTAEPAHPFANAVRRLDLDTGAEQRYGFGPGVIAEEHVPVPAGPNEADVWLVGTCLDLKAQRTRLNVFDARRVADGPVFAAALPYALTLGFHGNFATTPA